MGVQRFNITLPEEIAYPFRKSIPKRSRSKYMAEALKEKMDKEKTVEQNWIKALKENAAIYKEIQQDWEILDTENWPD